MSGRVVDIDADPNDPTHFYVAYASGGLWETRNNGNSFKPLFDNQAVMTIGDIAIDWSHDSTIWVGTGENNSSRSSYSGNGIYKSDNNGKTWQYMGLGESQHIGRIVIDPKNPQNIWIAAIGHLYSDNPERGVFKSSDGGKTWQKSFFVNEKTGAIDLVINSENPQILYAAMWQRERRAWNFIESGPASGIFKTVDGGKNWNKISTASSGLPTGKGVGRIGLAIYPGNPEILYTFLDNQFSRDEKEKPALSKKMLRNMSASKFLKLKGDDINGFLDRHNFPMKFNADTLLKLVKEKTIKPATLVEYLEDANSMLFDTPVIGAEVYRSDDGGISWHKTHPGYLDKMVYTFGYYFGQIRVSHSDPDQIYLLGVPLLKSDDAGKNFYSINGDNVHVDHHAIWVNPNNPGHLINGNDGGLNISYDDGKTWLKANHPPVGQFYTVAVDMAKPYNVYGGLQDNGVWYGPSYYKSARSWQSSGHYPYKSLLGGDGMQIAIDTRDNNTVYTGYQFGNYYRIDKNSRKQTYITPKHKLGERPLRFNWQSPIHLSIHNQDILYMGSHKFHRSMDRGDHWETLSDDLTSGGQKGDVPYGTLTSIHESPLKFGLIYAGSDDGLIHLSRDGGFSWNRISDPLPQNYWISRVQASAHNEGTVYAALNGYRWDNFECLIFRSDNFGETWQQVGENLPGEPVNVFKEDPHNPHILYVGSDHGLYVSIDDGKSFMAFAQGLPDAPVHDLVIHPRENDLIVGTHGRSIYIANVEALQSLDAELMAKKLHLFPIKDINYRKRWRNLGYDWQFNKAPEINISLYAKENGNATIGLLGNDNFLFKEKRSDCDSGLNFTTLSLEVDSMSIAEYQARQKTDNDQKIKTADNGKFYLPAGEYSITAELDGEIVTQKFNLKAPEKKSRKKQKKIP